MRRISILLIIGVLLFGGLHPHYVLADGHANFQGQTESMCNSTHSTDNSCLSHSNQSIVANFTFNNLKKPFLKALNSYFNASVSIPPERQQVRFRFLEKQPNNGINLTGIVVKIE